MTDRLKTAWTIRIGAERLRQLAAMQSDVETASEMFFIAGEMDENAAELEQSLTDRPPELLKAR